MYIDNLGITPQLRRAGIASRLLAAMRELARGEGCESTGAANSAARSAASRLPRCGVRHG